VESPTHHWFVDVDVTIPDFQVEAAIRIGADPGLVMNRCSLTAKIRQGHQVTGLAFLTFGKTVLFHEGHLPTKLKFSVIVYTKL
jgi:hypothetical protein